MFNYSLKKNYKFFITVFITILCFLTTLISVGFGALNQDLNIAGDVEYDEHSRLLYDVLRKAANVGTYAKEYTGEHHDSFTEEPSKSIYYWYEPDGLGYTALLDKVNVLFAGYCWQMMRTTDTGGVKIIYNGVPSEGKCTSDRTDRHIGKSKFNSNDSSISDIGYMYNTRYESISKIPDHFYFLQTKLMTDSSNYYYGSDITYNSSTNKYTLTGITQNTWTNTYSSSSGLYTCVSTTETTCVNPYYIVGGNSRYMYGFLLQNGHLLDYYDTNIVFGTGYTINNGIYTLTETSTVTKSDLYTDYRTYNHLYTCLDSSSSCSNIKYITNAENYNMMYFEDKGYIYGNDFTYNSSTGKYTLGSDRQNIWHWIDDDNDFSTHHYTCFNSTGECSKLSYVYGMVTASWGRSINYINLQSGKSVEDAINEMLYDDNVNQFDSTIKTYIDNWYASNMVGYSNKLEDTVFCDNRSQSNQSTNGWNPNGGNVFTGIHFKFDELQCTTDTDRFSVSNNKAKLTYPVGLANRQEISLISNKNVLSNDENYWLISPYSSSNSDTYNVGYVYSSGQISSTFVTSTYAVRPVVSLKPGTEYASGTGTRDNPYVVQ